MPKPVKKLKSATKKTIQEYLPIKSKTMTMVQGRIPTEIHFRVKSIMVVKNLSWADVLRACLRQFVDDHSKKN